MDVEIDSSAVGKLQKGAWSWDSLSGATTPSWPSSSSSSSSSSTWSSSSASWPKENAGHQRRHRRSCSYDSSTSVESEEADDAWKHQIKGVWSSLTWAKFDAILIEAGYQLYTRHDFVPSCSIEQDKIAFLAERQEAIDDYEPYDCVRRAHNLNASGGKPKQVFVRALLRANEASQEMKILKLLRREDLRNEPDNLSVHVEDIIEHDQDGCRIYFILQRAAGEHCWDHSFTTLEWHRFILDLFKGVCFLHKNGIAHLDLGPTNVLYDTRTKKATIIDFEGSQLYTNGQTQPMSTSIIAISSRLPEYRRGKSILVYPADVWLLGDMLLQMSRYHHQNDDLAALFKFMTIREPAARPTMAYALNTLEHILSARDT